MINFFRKIRQKLLSENKFSKYLIYAIGEIVLVVIGILIALQINTWNEGRKERAEEIETLRNIKSDFQNAIREFEENNAFKERVISSTSRLYEIMYSSNWDYPKPRLDSLMVDIFLNPTYNGQSETLNILFNSGKINIIRNDSIKNALVLWPQQIEDVTEDEAYAGDVVFHELEPLVISYVSLKDIYATLQFRNYKLFNHSTPGAFESNYDGLFRDRKFEGFLAARELSVSISYIQTKELIASANDIIRLIDNEINDQK